MKNHIIVQMGRGAWAGLIGTLGMTVLGMKPGAARMLPEDMQPERWLPRTLTRRIARAAGVRTGGGAREALLAAALHLGYGAAAGTLYSVLRRRRRLPGWLEGTGYGLAIWALSYEGWIPALGLLPRTTDAQPRQWVVPVGSHLVYGVTTALTYERLASR